MSGEGRKCRWKKKQVWGRLLSSKRKAGLAELATGPEVDWVDSDSVEVFLWNDGHVRGKVYKDAAESMGSQYQGGMIKQCWNGVVEVLPVYNFAERFL